MPKSTLKVWNVRSYMAHTSKDKRWDNVRPGDGKLYICAHSVADIVRLLQEYLGAEVSESNVRTEIRVYGSDCWGVAMEGVVHERGIWISFGRWSKPIKVV